MGNLVMFARSLFGIGKEPRVKGLGIPARPRHPQGADDEERKLRHRIIAIITWGMFTAFALSLLGTVILAVAGRTIPDVLPEILFATLGYFGGAFASFMRFDSGGS
jgi:hypothetical protein